MRRNLICSWLLGLLVLLLGRTAPADDAGFLATPCGEVLDAYSVCLLAYRRAAGDPAMHCEGRVGADVLRGCLAAEAEAFGDAPEQLAALRRLKAVSRHVKVEAHGLRADSEILRVCHRLAKELPKRGVVRRAVVTSASRPASHQARMLAAGSKLAAKSSNHQLGLACDLTLSGYRSYNKAVLAARKVLDELFGRAFSKQIRLFREPTISTIHIDPSYARSPHYRSVRTWRIRKLKREGVLRPGTPEDRTPRFDTYVDGDKRRLEARR